MEYIIYINGKDVCKVSGADYVNTVYLKACEFAELTGSSIFLVDADTGEIVDCYDGQE